MSSFLSDFYPILYKFFEFFKFKTGKYEITPKFVSRTPPVTINFPVNRIYRSKFFSLAGTAATDAAGRPIRRPPRPAVASARGRCTPSTAPPVDAAPAGASCRPSAWAAAPLRSGGSPPLSLRPVAARGGPAVRSVRPSKRPVRSAIRGASVDGLRG